VSHGNAGDETVLVAVISAYEEDSARTPELSVGAAEFATMRRTCLLYLADHGGVDAIRHDVVSFAVAGERQARLRHFIGAWRWEESKGWPRMSDHEVPSIVFRKKPHGSWGRYEFLNLCP